MSKAFVFCNTLSTSFKVEKVEQVLFGKFVRLLDQEKGCFVEENCSRDTLLLFFSHLVAEAEFSEKLKGIIRVDNEIRSLSTLVEKFIIESKNEKTHSHFQLSPFSRATINYKQSMGNFACLQRSKVIYYLIFSCLVKNFYFSIFV